MQTIKAERTTMTDSLTNANQSSASSFDELNCLKVSSKSSPASVAGAIAGMIKDKRPVGIQAVGAGAVNQAVKAIAISRGFLSPVGIEIACAPSFADIVIDGEYRTAIRFSVEPRVPVSGAISAETPESASPHVSPEEASRLLKQTSAAAG